MEGRKKNSGGAKKSAGGRIIGALEEAIAHKRGALQAKTVRVPTTAREYTAKPAPKVDPETVLRVRTAHGMSQHVFAHALNVSRETVRSWEQGKRTPDGAAVRLLQVAEAHPGLLGSFVTKRSAKK